VKSEIASLIAKSQGNLTGAQLLYQGGLYDIAVSRAYYAMFYLVSAALLNRGVTLRRHSAVVAAFSEHFVKNGVLPTHLHRHLLDAFDQRTRGDYRVFEEVSREEAHEQLERAEEFVGIVKAFLEQESQT
jgi:uncharacterized protein (UPF0332 family)